MQENPSPTVQNPAPDSPGSTSPSSAPQPESKRDFTLPIVGIALVALAFKFPDKAYNIAVFILTLSVLVFVHEWGHYQFGRWGGMKVNRFAIGFPPWIYTKRRNGIDYSIGALPIGGMVDIAGLGSEEDMVATGKGEETKPLTQRRNVPHGEKQFQEASLGWRFLTLFAGPLMNFIYAILIFISVFTLLGVPEKAINTTEVDFVMVGQPADKAGIQKGDDFVAVNGVKPKDQLALAKLIRGVKEPQMTVTVERDGKLLTKTIEPIFDEGEQKLEGKGTERVATIGVMFLQKVTEVRKVGPVEAVERGFYAATGLARNILSMLGRAVTGQLSSREVRGIKGPVGILEVTSVTAEKTLSEFLFFTGALSLNLGLINLLPLPALDGGRILFLGYELVMRRPIDPSKETAVHVVGMVMLLSFMLLVTVRDIFPYAEKWVRGLTQG
jgi:regulator of sigma E protease